MKTPRPGRWRRRFGAALIAGGILWAALMIVSARWWFGYSTNSWLADIGDGTLYTQSFAPGGFSRPLVGWCGGDNSGVNNTRRSWTWTWWAWGRQKGTWQQGFNYSVWPLAPLLLVAGASLLLPGLRAARRIRNDLCARCGYPRTGLAQDAPCPECGN